MSDRRKWTLLLTMALATLALVLLASGLSTVPFSTGDLRDLLAHPQGRSTSPALGTSTAAADVFWLLWGALLVVLALIVALASRLYRHRHQPEYELVHEQPRGGRWVVWLVLALLALGVFALFRWGWPQIQHLSGKPAQTELPSPPPHASPPSQPSPLSPASNPVTELPAWIGLALAGLAVAFSVSGLAWLLWRRKAEQLERSDGRREIADLAAQAAREIESGSEIQDVVLRSYREMSRVLNQRASLAEQRLRALTPREFEEELQRVGVQSEYVTRLTRLFERVRYGERLADQLERRAALDCLQAIEQAYGQTNHERILGTAA